MMVTVPLLMLIGLLLAGAVVALILARATRRRAQPAYLTARGQEAEVIVNGSYRPAVVAVRKGVPVRLRFVRLDDNPCSERVIFEGFRVNRALAPYAATEVELLPDKAGEYLFTCQMGMYQGWLVVR
jgi:plastocyanin domain-containing protein